MSALEPVKEAMRDSGLSRLVGLQAKNKLHWLLPTQCRSFALGRKTRLQTQGLIEAGEIVGHCDDCGRLDNFASLIGLKEVMTPAAIDQPTASPEIQPPDESPVLDNVEPPQVEWTEPEIPAGREPGSDDEPEPTKPDAEFMWLDEFCKQPVRQVG